MQRHVPVPGVRSIRRRLRCESKRAAQVCVASDAGQSADRRASLCTRIAGDRASRGRYGGELVQLRPVGHARDAEPRRSGRLSARRADRGAQLRTRPVRGPTACRSSREVRAVCDQVLRSLSLVPADPRARRERKLRRDWIGKSAMADPLAGRSPGSADRRAGSAPATSIRRSTKRTCCRISWRAGAILAQREFRVPALRSDQHVTFEVIRWSGRGGTGDPRRHRSDSRVKRP